MNASVAADDLTQKTFLGCLEAIERIRIHTSFRAVRLLALSHSRLQPDSNCHLHWEGYDQELDVTLTAGLVACITYAAHLNRHLASPAGHDYGAFADAGTDWLFNHYSLVWRD